MDPVGAAAIRVLTKVQVVVEPETTVIAASDPLSQLALVRVHPIEGVSLILKRPPAFGIVNVKLPVPPTVVRDVAPKLFGNENVPSPPTVFFTTRMNPGGGGATAVLVKVQVVVIPESTVIATVVPLVQFAPVWAHPAGTFSIAL
jgi:hypothetical protein